MGKKKGSGKLAGMTEEERFLYLEEQRHRESEIQKQKEDMLTQFLKDKLAKEEKFARMNMDKLVHGWRAIMRIDKTAALVRESEILSQTFERQLDSKDCQLKAAVKNLLEVEQQAELARRSHLMMVDKLADHHRRYLDALRHEFEGEQEALVGEFDEERAIMDAQHEQEMSDIGDIKATMDQRAAEKAEDDLIEFNNNRDEIKNKNLEEKHSLRVQLETVVKQLWDEFEEALDDYRRNTEEKRAMFETNKIKDEKDAVEIATNMRRMYRLQGQINRLKVSLDSTSSEAGWKNGQMRKEVEGMHAHFMVLKKQMEDLRTYEANRMIKLTVQSAEALKKLREKAEKGQRILRLAETCRKKETEEEKVLPFFASSLTSDEADLIHEATMIEEPRQKLAEMMRMYAPLENFWKRYNKVLLDKLALEKEKQILVEESIRLRMLLKQYLDGISVNDEVLDKTNPLFIVNYQAQKGMLRVPVVDRRIRRQAPNTVIEAAHAQQTKGTK